MLPLAAIVPPPRKAEVPAAVGAINSPAAFSILATANLLSVAQLTSP